MLALGSANQLKVSRPMSSASWEHTAAKLHQPHKVSPYPYPSPNPFPSPTPTPNPSPSPSPSPNPNAVQNLCMLLEVAPG